MTHPVLNMKIIHLLQKNDSSQWSNQECKALSDLISLFPKLFLIDKQEIERENKIREVLEKHHNSYTSIPQSFKPSGDLKVWIYLKSKESGDYVNITVSFSFKVPSKILKILKWQFFIPVSSSQDLGVQAYAM